MTLILLAKFEMLSHKCQPYSDYGVKPAPLLLYKGKLCEGLSVYVFVFVHNQAILFFREECRYKNKR